MQQRGRMFGMEHVPVRLHHSPHEQAVVGVDCHMCCMRRWVLGPEIV